MPQAELGQAPDVAIDVRSLAKRFQLRAAPPRTVLEGVDLQVRAGEFVAIVGRSGCGKSTLLRMLLGIVAPDAGSVSVLDGAPGATRPGEVVLVFQEYARSLLPWRSALGNVRFGVERLGLPKGVEAERVELSLARVGLEPFRNAYPAQLSGGMQQRLQLARAIAAQPRVMLLDEPFGSLDALTRYELEDQLQELCAAGGMTTILVTHDIDEAIYLADRVVVLGGVPAAVQLDVPIELERPRQQDATKSMPEFAQYRAQLVAELLGPETAV
jgi:NitT/TauT family transport system ATP-binding protein